jgi:DNA-binding response OmpR family regulator
MESRKRVYVVEDDRDIRGLVNRVLSGYGFAVRSFETGDEARRTIVREPPDMCIVDLGLPDMDGLTLVREIREKMRFCVIILSARGGLSDRVLGLEIGADDYLVKPFEPRELVARVNSVLRRSGFLTDERSAADIPKIRFGSWLFNVGTLELIHDDGHIESLTAAEASLLLALVKNPNRVMSREQLQRTDIWNDDPAFERSIDVRVSRIRKKIEREPRTPRFIKTVYGAGYLFASDVRWDDR